MITKKETQQIAKLARLDLTEEEIKKYQKELSLILDYIEKLKKVNVEDVVPDNYLFGVKNEYREDEPGKKRTIENEKLLKLAPETKNNYLKVGSVKKDWA